MNDKIKVYKSLFYEKVPSYERAFLERKLVRDKQRYKEQLKLERQREVIEKKEEEKKMRDPLEKYKSEVLNCNVSVSDMIKEIR